MTDSDLYQAWLHQYSESNNPIEALAKVREEVDELLKLNVPPLEVRVAALEQFMRIWTDFMLSIFYVQEIWAMSPEHVVDRTTDAMEFLRLASLSQAIRLDKLANEGEEE